MDGHACNGQRESFIDNIIVFHFPAKTPVSLLGVLWANLKLDKSPCGKWSVGFHRIIIVLFATAVTSAFFLLATNSISSPAGWPLKGPRAYTGTYLKCGIMVIEHLLHIRCWLDCPSDSTQWTPMGGFKHFALITYSVLILLANWMLWNGE